MSDLPSRLGPYRVLLELASGGMGAVYIARHVAAGGFERLVVIKRVHRHLLKSREFADMFRDEARLASLIRHPNVVSVDDVAEESGELFLVQPYVESLTLAELLALAKAAGERVPPTVAVRVLSDTLAGLEGAHEAKDLRGAPLEIVHRDVSPQNVLVGTDGRSRLIDFGIAKAARRLTVTNSGVLKGKLGYMAPEQFKHLPIDTRADVFAAGVVLYEALVGQRPFDGEDEADTLLSVLIGEPTPPSATSNEIPAAIDLVVERALARDRDGRYSSAAELHEALERALMPAPPREVAAWVARLGEAKLEARRAEIEAALDDASSPASRPTRPPNRSSLPSDPRARTSTAGRTAEQESSSLDQRRSESEPQRVGRRRMAWIALAGALCVSIGIGVFALRSTGASETRVSRSPEPPLRETANTASSSSALSDVEPAPPRVEPAPTPVASSTAAVSSSKPKTPVTRPRDKGVEPNRGPKPELQKSPYGSP